MATSKSVVDYTPLLKRAYLQLNELREKLDSMDRAQSEPIAIIGMGCRFPGADNPDGFWLMLENRTNAIGEIPRSRWDAAALFDSNPQAPGKSYTKRGGFLREVDTFDADFFGISPREAMRMDPQQRLLLEVAWEALEDAGQVMDQLAGSRTGVFVGVCTSDYSQIVFRDITQIDAYCGTGTSLSMVAGRLSYFLDLRGPSLAIDTACSSSLVAVHQACNSLRLHESDLAIAGGVSLTLLPENFIMGSKMGVFAADGRCKTFDAKADGTVGGEGCGVVVLKRLSDAVRDGDPVRALIRGSAVNQDGKSVGLTAPNGRAQQAVIREALRNARVNAAEIAYVEAHGTGTVLGDPIEAEALTAVLASPGERRQPCAVGAVKANIGHLLSAAGVSGLIKTVLCLQHAEIPPQINLDKLNPNISFSAESFVIPRSAQAWPSVNGARYAAVSSFGWSGTNCHVILEEARSDEQAAQLTVDTPRMQLLPISARSPTALRAIAEAYSRSFLTEPLLNSALSDICYTATARRSHHKYRAAIVSDSHEDFARQLALSAGESQTNELFADQESNQPWKVAFVFSGQGIRIQASFEELEAEPAFKQKFIECEAAIAEHFAKDLRPEIRGPGTDDVTSIDQLRNFTWQVSLAELWRSWGVEPSAVVGHSLGEVAAAHVSGALNLEDAVRVASERGRIMQEELAKTGDRGLMAVLKVGLPEGIQALKDTGGRVSIAAHNSPETVVISGASEMVSLIVERMAQEGIRVNILSLPAGHSAHAESWRTGLVEALNDLHGHPSTIPIYSTVTAKCESGTRFDGAYWGENVRQTVRFADAIQEMSRDGYNVFLEFSGHPVLTAAVSQCLNETENAIIAVGSLCQEEPARQSLLGALGVLYVNGFDLNSGRLYEPRGACVSLPNYPWQRERYWSDSNSSSSLGFHRDPAMSNTAEEHPALRWGSEIAQSVPGSTVHVWEAEISTTSLPYLSDHRIEGAIVVAGACFLELVSEAVACWRDWRNVALTDVAFCKALFLDDQVPYRLQIVLSQEENQQPTFQVYSKPAAMGTDEGWTLNVSGRIRGSLDEAVSTEDSIDFDEIVERCATEIAAADFYSEMRDSGNQWGPAFQGIEKIWRGPKEVIARLSIPQILTSESSRYRFHPALLDACVQVIAAARLRDGSASTRGAWIGTGVKEVCFWADPEGSEFWSHATIRDGDHSSYATADVRVCDSSGRVLITLREVKVRYLAADFPYEPNTGTSGWFHQLQWVKADSSISSGADQAAENGAPAKIETAAPAITRVAGNRPSANEAAGEWLIFGDMSELAVQLESALNAGGAPALPGKKAG